MCDCLRLIGRRSSNRHRAGGRGGIWLGFLALALGSAPGIGGGETPVALTDELYRPPLPIQTRIEVTAVPGAPVQARLTLVFPHSGFEVTDWGEPAFDGNRIAVDLDIASEPIALPVVTELSHVYDLGSLNPGDYVFEATAGEHVLGRRPFTVAELPRPPASADLQVRVRDDRRALARVRVVFHRPGFRVSDWGGVSFDGDRAFEIRAIATPEVDAAEIPGTTLKQRHVYRLAEEPLAPGRYHVRFRLNGHTLAKAEFTVDESPGIVARIDDEPLIEPGQATHPIRIRYWHPSGIDPSTLGDRNIRVVGPNGYKQFATLAEWKPAPATSGGAIVATYLAHAPGPVWTAQDNGAYSVSLMAGSVRARSGYEFPAWRLGILQVAIPEIPEEPPGAPWAEVIAGDITAPGPDPHPFQIRFHGEVDVESVREARIRVAGPHGYAVEAELCGLFSTSASNAPGTVFAVYRAAAPRGGWSALHNGFYGIFLPHRTIKDVHGNSVVGGLAGGFDVRIRPTPEPGRPRLVFRTETDSTGRVLAHLAFEPGDTQWRVLEWGERVHLSGHTFVARAVIHEYAMPPYGPQQKTYALGRLLPGLYGFVWHGSNGFVSRHLFRVGPGTAPAPPFERWLHAATELAAATGDPPPDGSDEAAIAAYAFGMDAGGPGGARVRPALRIDRDGGRMVLSHAAVPTAADVAYRIEASRDLVQWEDWTDRAELRELREHADGTCWRILDVSAAAHEDGWPVPAGDLTEAADEGPVFFRIRAEHQPAPEPDPE